MNPEQALKALDEAASLANLQRSGHVLVQQAVKVLSNFLAAAQPATAIEEIEEPPDASRSNGADHTEDAAAE